MTPKILKQHKSVYKYWKHENLFEIACACVYIYIKIKSIWKKGKQSYLNKLQV